MRIYLLKRLYQSNEYKYQQHQIMIIKKYYYSIITGVTATIGRKNVEIMVPLKYLSNFLRTLEMPLINCETNLILTCSEKCLLSNDKKATNLQ